MTLPANLTAIIQIALFILGAYALALFLGMLVWTWKDVSSRSRDLLVKLLSLLLVLVFNVPGLLLYFILRPRETLSEVYARDLEEEALLQEIEDRRTCPECDRRVEPDFVLCPWCHAELHGRCVVCGQMLNVRWDVCPFCAEPVEAEAEVSEVESGEPDGPELDEIKSDLVEEVPIEQVPEAVSEGQEPTPPGTDPDGETGAE